HGRRERADPERQPGEQRRVEGQELVRHSAPHPDQQLALERGDHTPVLNSRAISVSASSAAGLSSTTAAPAANSSPSSPAWPAASPSKRNSSASSPSAVSPRT